MPLQVAHKATEVYALALQVASTGNLNAISDAGSAAALAQACLTGAGLNVRINCLNLADAAAASAYQAQVTSLDNQVALLANELRQVLVNRGHLSL